MPPPETLNLVVLDKETVAAGVIRLTLGHEDGRVLPAWEPGAHIDLHVGEPATLIRQYSLCSSPAHSDRYEVAVLREPESRGGSAYLVDRLSPGDHVPVSLPRNNFALVPAGRYIFVAGGIGITPILPMITAAESAGAEWTLLYGGRTRGSKAFADDLVETWGPRVSVRTEDEYGLLDLTNLLATPTPDTAIYCCGPGPLLDAVEVACASWPPGALHVERFAPGEVASAAGEDTEFEVEFAKSGVTLNIPADRSIMEVAEKAGIPITYSCEEGTCGSCETAVLAGEPEHRDFILTDAERQEGTSLMVCVSRARSPRLVLDA